MTGKPVNPRLGRPTGDRSRGRPTFQRGGPGGEFFGEPEQTITPTETGGIADEPAVAPGRFAKG